MRYRNATVRRQYKIQKKKNEYNAERVLKTEKNFYLISDVSGHRLKFVVCGCRRFVEMHLYRVTNQLGGYRSFF